MDKAACSDIALDPNFASNNLVYLAYAEPGDDGVAGTAVARGKLGDGSLDDVQVIFRQKPKVQGGNHFGGRLVFAPDGKLFVTLGERFTFQPAQDLSVDLGKIVRINPDGIGARRQSVRRPGGQAAGDLVVRSPQRARRRHSSRDRRSCGRPSSARSAATS